VTDAIAPGGDYRRWFWGIVGSQGFSQSRLMFCSWIEIISTFCLCSTRLPLPEPEDIVYPVRSILRKSPNISFLMNDVTEIDFVSRLVKTSDHEFPYDFLILATGSTSHFFGVTGAIEYAFQLKTLEQAIVLRNHILSGFERALCEDEAGRREHLLTFAIVGGGPTGVEFAGALAELVRGPLVKDYPTLDFREVRILLLEATHRLLPSLPERLQAYAQARLHKMGVEVHLQAMISQVTPLAVHFEMGLLAGTLFGRQASAGSSIS
jgi:NADH dehydrogenase